MKPYLPTLTLVILLIGCQSKEDQRTYSSQIPFQLKTGYGPFYPNFDVFHPQSPQDPLWGSIYKPIQGIPKNWSNKMKSMIWLNARQLVYQNYKQGRITPANYQRLQQDWKWTPDTTTLTETPIQCFLNVVSGFDEDRGQWAVLIDTDNDLDLGNEKPIYPQLIKPGTVLDRLTDFQLVDYEAYQRGQVKRLQLPMVIKRMGDSFVYHFAQYGVASIKVGDDTHEIFISSGFCRPDFETTTLIKATSCLKSGKIDPQQLVELGETIKIGGIDYTNKGLDRFYNWLELEASTVSPLATHNLQAGVPFQPLIAHDFVTGKPFSTADPKGKYIYIDFWGTWCKGCVAELPQLEQLYKEVDHQRVEFVSIACHDSAKRLRGFLSHHPLDWPQVLSDEDNKLVERYRISSFPSSVLIDPQGMIVARNLYGSALADKLKALTGTK